MKNFECFLLLGGKSLQRLTMKYAPFVVISVRRHIFIEKYISNIRRSVTESKFPGHK
jgi:hypothetical protein